MGWFSKKISSSYLNDPVIAAKVKDELNRRQRVRNGLESEPPKSSGFFGLFRRKSAIGGRRTRKHSRRMRRRYTRKN